MSHRTHRWTAFLQALLQEQPEQGRLQSRGIGGGAWFGGAYGQIGLALLIVGVGLVLVAFLLLRSVPLTALGTSAIILSMVCFGLERSLPRISVPLGHLLMEAGRENIAALVEELGLRSKALYLPSSFTGDRPQALIPFSTTPSALGGLEIHSPLPRRLIVHYGGNHSDMGLLVTTPGSQAVLLLEGKPGPTLGELESALGKVLVGELDAVGSVAVSRNGHSLTMQLSRLRAQMPGMACDELLGSPLASIAAAVTAEAMDRPVAITREEGSGDRLFVELELH